MTPTILPAHALLDDLQTRGVNLERCWVADNSYAVPSLKWVDEEYAAAWSKLKRLLDIDDFIPEAGDCDDFADLCAAYMKLLHRKTKQRPPMTGLGSGVCWYASPRFGRHALKHFWHMLRGKLALDFFEPQANQTVELSPDEIASGQFKF